MPDDFDVLASIIFYPEEKGGRKNMLPIKSKDYNYSPPVFINSDQSITHTAAVVIFGGLL